MCACYQFIPQGVFLYETFSGVIVKGFSQKKKKYFFHADEGIRETSHPDELIFLNKIFDVGMKKIVLHNFFILL